MSNRYGAFLWWHCFYIYVDQTGPRRRQCENSERQREGRGERGKMEKNTMKWLNRLRLPKSFLAPIRQRKSRLLAFCLLSNLTRQGGKRKGAKVSGGWDWIEGWCRDTDGFKGGQFSKRNWCTHLSTTPSYTRKLVLHRLTKTPTKIHI